MVYQKNENGSYSNISTPKKGGIIHAIGEIYIQYPGEADPNTLFPNMTWQNVSSNYAGAFFRTKNGAFFRAEGGNAQSFNCTVAQPMGSSLANLIVGNGGTTSSAGAHTHAPSTTMTPYYQAIYWEPGCSYICTKGGGWQCTMVCAGKPSQDGYPNYVIPGTGWCNCCYYVPYPQVGNATLYSGVDYSTSPTHYHNAYICNSGSVETRPNNYTIRIWKRVA